MSEQVRQNIAGRSITLYPAKNADRPLILLNNFSGDGSSVVQAMQEAGCPDCNLVSIGNLQWDHDMTPWYCAPLFPGDTPCTGGAAEYLDVLVGEILPEALSGVEGTPTFIGLAGYSLAGLFALWAMYHTDRFSRAASMSGSLWFPDFREYAISHEMAIEPDCLYLSLGDREAKTKNPVLQKVQDNTEELAAFYRGKGISVTYELNPGNHFRDAALRSARGIAALLNM